MEFKTRVSKTGEDLKKDEISYDIKMGTEAIKQFARRSKTFNKDFKKLTKKMNGADPQKQIKENTKFSKNNLFPIFRAELEKVFFKRNELEFLDDKILNTYILGCFIAGSAQEPNIKNNLDKIYVKVLVEICEKSQNNRMTEDKIT